MRLFTIIVILLLSYQAQACYKHKIWRYPWPQFCYKTEVVRTRIVHSIVVMKKEVSQSTTFGQLVKVQENLQETGAIELINLGTRTFGIELLKRKMQE